MDFDVCHGTYDCLNTFRNYSTGKIFERRNRVYKIKVNDDRKKTSCKFVKKI